MQKLRSLPFEDWVTHVFDHDVGGSESEWYFDPAAPVWLAPAELTLAHLTRLFSDPVPYLKQYDDLQLNQGFWYLVHNACSSHMFALTDASADLQTRIRCLQSFTVVFEKLFAERCSSDLSHLNPPNAYPLNSACYMWWDLIPFFPAPGDPSRRELDSTALSVMEEVLALDSLACRESALHGLGHWHSGYPGRVDEIIARALGDAKNWTPELTAYARSARSGCVQ